MSMNCAKKKCTQRTFMDTDKCFDHQYDRAMMAIISIWCAAILAGLAVTGVIVWAFIELVLWVTSK